MKRFPRTRGRTSRSLLLVLAVLSAGTGSGLLFPPLLGGQDRGPRILGEEDRYLRLVASVITPGSISAPVRGVWFQHDRRDPRGPVWGHGRMTEDRHLRVFDWEGSVVRSVRTGMRRAVDLVQDRRGLVSVIDHSGTIHRAGLGIPHGELPRFAPLADLAVTPRGMWLDRNDNYFVTATPREIIHVSAAGRVLWRRNLPSAIRAEVCTGDGSALFLATGDGAVYLFRDDGSGRVVFRLEEPFAAMAYDPGVSPLRIVGVDDSGAVSALTVLEDNTGRRQWTRRFPAGTTLLGIDRDGGVWLLDRHHTIVVLDREGNEGKRITVPGSTRDRSALNGIYRQLYVVDDENRLRTIAHDGHVESALQLRDSPRSILFVPETGELLVEYGEWRLEVYRTGSTGSTAGPAHRPASTAAADRESLRSSALGMLVATVLEGNSRVERERALLVLRDRVEEESLFGHVAAARTGAIHLLRELASDRNFPGVRREAASVLGLFLDLPSRSALVEAIRSDPDTGTVSHVVRELARYPAMERDALEYGRARLRNSTGDNARVLVAGLLDYLETVIVPGQHYAGTERSLLEGTIREILASPSATREQLRRGARILERITDPR